MDPPPFISLSQEELEANKITKKPVILQRITVSYSDPSSSYFSKHKDIISQYDIIAYAPQTELALKHSFSAIDVDIIVIPHELKARQFKNLFRQAVERELYFEVSYGLSLSNQDGLESAIKLSHMLHQLCRSANIIITSHAMQSRWLRHPYDVINLGRFFALSEGASKNAISMLAHNVVYCARARRSGASKCAATIDVLEEESICKKFKGLDDASLLAKADVKVND